jgi:hypothetical protein
MQGGFCGSLDLLMTADAGRELAVRYVLALAPIVFDGKLRKLDTEEVRGTVL